MYSDHVIGTLNDIIQNCKDGELGFKACADHADSPALQKLFGARAMECREAARELQAIVYAEAGDPPTGGTAAGAMHRGWVKLKAALSANDDKAMLEECERGEDRALARYRAALEDDLPVDVRAVLERQRLGAQRNHDQVRTLRDQARAAAHH